MSISYEEETREWLGEGLEFEEALAPPESLEEDPYFFVRSYTSNQGDVWQASRIGDTERLRYGHWCNQHPFPFRHCLTSIIHMPCFAVLLQF